MRIAVFGLGYVGAVVAACLARDGHHVIGVDPQPEKVARVNAGTSPILEAEVDDLMAAAVDDGRLSASSDAGAAVATSEMSLICVGTPSHRNGSLDTGPLVRACGEVGAAIAAASRPHMVVIRSTVLPGTVRQTAIPALTAAGAGPHLARVAYNPEFLRQASAVRDYDTPAKTVVGADDPAVAHDVLALFDKMPGAKIATTIETAELLKYADNAWHATKVAFANEIGAIAKAAAIDSHQLMEIFCADRKLNISDAYLRPGFAFGGSCLPKDVRALVHHSRQQDLDLPLLQSLMPANQMQIDRAVQHILASGCRRVAILGISFKAGTDDLRESPQVALVERLIGKGIDVRIYDRNVHMARLIGANRAYIMHAIPHIANLLSDDLAGTVAHGELVVIGNNAPEFRSLPELLTPGQRVYDLVRVAGVETSEASYDGVNW
ncbi:MAG: nucleotide sugar dehydrogenase [Pikeienuella sp.]